MRYHVHFLYTKSTHKYFLKMARMSLEMRERVLTLHSHGYTVPEIHYRLCKENCVVSVQSFYNLLRIWCEKGTIADLPRSRKPRKKLMKCEYLLNRNLPITMNWFQLVSDQRYDMDRDRYRYTCIRRYRSGTQVVQPKIHATCANQETWFVQTKKHTAEEKCLVCTCVHFQY